MIIIMVTNGLKVSMCMLHTRYNVCKNMVDLMRYKLTLGLLSTFVNDDLSPATAVLFEYELNQYY